MLSPMYREVLSYFVVLTLEFLLYGHSLNKLLCKQNLLSEEGGMFRQCSLV